MQNEPKKSGAKKTALIAMSQRGDANDIASLLAERHGMETKCEVDGASAWTSLQASIFDFIVINWKLPRLAGAALLNRLKQDVRYVDKPVIIVSELTQKENFTLLLDYPFVGLADGPFSLKAFAIKLDLLTDEIAKSLPDSAKLAPILNRFSESSSQAKADLFALLDQMASPAAGLYVVAKKLRQKELLGAAEELLNEALRRDNKSNACALELAAIYHLNERHSKARQLLEQQKFSKKNIERMLLLGSLSFHELKATEAKAAFAGALAIDPDHGPAKAGALVAGNLVPLFDKNAQEAPPSTFVEALDRVAQQKSKASQEQAGIDNYKAALAFALDSLSRATILFNIGLCYERLQKKPEALDWLGKAAKFGVLPQVQAEITRLKAGSAAPLAKATIKAAS